MEKTLQHVGRDLGDVLGSFLGAGFLASCPELQARETVRSSQAPHVETQKVGALWSSQWGCEQHPDDPLSSLERRSLRHPMKAPQKVQADAVPVG